MARTHVIIDDAVLNAIDAIAGEHGRSQFLETAAQEKLSRLALESAIQSTSGIVSGEDYPEWVTSEQTAAWVQAIRSTEPAA